MQEQRFYDIIGRILSGTATTREKKELEQILAADQELQRLYGVLFADTVEEKDHTEGMQAYTAHFAKMQLAGHFDNAQVNDSFEIGAKQKRKSLTVKYGMNLAAALLFITSFWFLLNKSLYVTDPVFNNEVLTKKGSQTYVKLPDGTEVWLNADSKLFYPDEFDKSRREVKLIGEAYFEVRSNRDRPFIIHAGATNIKVLGTAFNLRAYPDEKEVETTLIHGIVEVTLAQQPGNIIQMKAGEKLSVRNVVEEVKRIDDLDIDPSANEKAPVLVLSKTQVHSADSVPLEAAWRENRLAFDADNFGKMISKISKWYNVDIVVNNQDLYAATFTAIFENKTLDQVLDALQHTGRFTYRIKDNLVYID